MIKREQIEKEESVNLHVKALLLSQKEKIPYRKALLKVASFQDEGQTNVQQFKVMDKDAKVDPFSLKLHQKAKELAKEKSIPYKDALVRVSKDSSTKFAGIEDYTTPEAIEKHYKKVKKKLDSLGEDAKQAAIEGKMPLGEALCELAEHLKDIIYQLPALEELEED